MKKNTEPVLSERFSADLSVKQQERQRQRQKWLSKILHVPFTLSAASSDASFRSYFRVHLTDGHTRILMDAPPEREPLRAFIHAAHWLNAACVHVPTIYAEEHQLGFLLLSDLGEMSYFQALAIKNVTKEYEAALATMVIMQARVPCVEFPAYSEEMLEREMDLFVEWYLQKNRKIYGHLHLEKMWHRLKGLVLANIKLPTGMSNVTVHRDFHCRNLMASEPMPGVLDFQDAVSGPPTYDLVSLLKDAYVEWPDDQQLQWIVRYRDLAMEAGVKLPELETLLHHYHWMGVQRHLKILGIFSRLWIRDGKEGYLRDIPRVEGYLLDRCKQTPALAELEELLQLAKNNTLQQ